MSGKFRRSLVSWLVLSPFVVVTLFPFAVMLTTALKPRGEVRTSPPAWLPTEIAWGNFAAMWVENNFGRSVLDSLYVSGLATLGALLVSIPAAYALARYPFPGKGAYRQFLLTTQMLSPIVLVIGLFQMMAGFGLLDSLNVLAGIYAAFNIAFAVWMLQSYFLTIPRDLEEAAWMEGAGRLRAMVRVFLPLAVPAMTVTALFTFINAWNEFVLALTLLRSDDNFTLPIRVFSQVGGRYQVKWDHVMAATLLATVPVAAVFAWMQRYLVKGLALGGVK